MLNPYPSPHSDPEVLTRFQKELARTAAPLGLAPAGPALWPRFAGYYQGLAHLPRKARRALQRRWRRSLGGIALLCALGQAPALAATISVGGGCTLVDAILAANNDAPTGGCTAGSGADTLVLAAASTHTLIEVNNSTNQPNGFPRGATGLPLITSGITVAGNGSTITRDPGAPQFRILAVVANGDLTLQETTVSGGVLPDSIGLFSESGGGIAVFPGGGALTLTNSTVSGNRAVYGAGGGVVNSSGTLTLTNSTVSGNFRGGVRNSGTLTLTNSTVSGNSGLGGVDNSSGTLILVQTVVSGNTGPTGFASEVSNYSGGDYGAAAMVIANNLNVFGHDGVAGVTGFTPGPSDLVPSVPLAAILNPTLGDNGGLTRTHALVAGSPAADAVAAASCATASDQRGVLRPQDSDANTVADCDIGAFELQLSPPPPPPPPPDAAPANQNPQARCTASRCSIPIKCNLDPASGAQCTVRIDFFVSRSAVRSSEPASTKAPGRIRFAFGVTNIPPGETRNVRLRPTKQGKKIVRTSTRRSLRGVMEIRNSAGTVSSTRIRIRLR